jgi:hypothetical protein
MGWFSSHGSRGRKEAPPALAGPEVHVHKSLALAALLEGIRRDRKLHVLDLGAAVGSNIEFLSGYNCRLHIGDLYGGLSARRPDQSDGDELGPEFFTELFAFPESTRFDIVFAWDLFDYLSRRELAHLIRQLRRFCGEGSTIFAMVSILKQMPAQPLRFRILDPERLAYEPRTALQRPAARYAPAELNDLLRGFHVARSFLLRHGIQEYLFVRDPDPPAGVQSR